MFLQRWTRMQRIPTHGLTIIILHLGNWSKRMNELPEKIVSLYPPTVINCSDGTRFAVYSGSGWFQVDEDFTLEDAVARWEKWTPNSQPLNESIGDKSWQVESSKKGSFYTVRFNNGYWGCSCPANTYHRNKECRHIREIKEKNS